MHHHTFKHSHFIIFDVGSNATKASLVRVEQPPQIEKNWRIETGLTRYIQSDGALSREGVCVLLQALKVVCTEASVLVGGGIDKYAIGTEALRRICNSDAVIEAFRLECGVELSVISADREAELERRAVRMTEVYQRNRDKCILCIDSGGSSTEFNFLVPGRDEPISGSYPYGQHDIKAAIQTGAAMPFDPMFDALKTLCLQHCPELIIVAGSSFTSYARHALKLTLYSDELVESRAIEAGAPVPSDDMKAACGSALVSAIKKVVIAPVYATTRGIRHGWIDCMTNV